MTNADLRKYCVDPSRSTRKGRSESRIFSRDIKIAYRFYYHSEILRRVYAVVISALSEEFDVDQRVVTDRLKERQTELDRIYKEKPSVLLLRKRYPYFTW